MYTSQSPLYIIHTPVYTVIYFPLFYNIHIMYTVVYGVNIFIMMKSGSLNPPILMKKAIGITVKANLMCFLPSPV